MPALSSSDYLELWERGIGLHPLDQGLLILGFDLSEGLPAPADWPLGERNRALAELRLQLFGHQMEGWVACPRCDEKMEFELDVRALTQEAATPAPVEVKGHRFRLPTSRDLALVAGASDSDAASRRLLDRCRIDSGEAVGWTEEDLEEAGDRFALADPLAETRLDLRCEECGHEWDEQFDIAAFLWDEIAAWAKRLLADVHALASAYGWTEREILSLSESRRTLYRKMVQT